MVTHAQAWDSSRERRISYLARPKVNQQIICNKVSVYWTDKPPPKAHRFTVPESTQWTSARAEQTSFCPMSPPLKRCTFQNPVGNAVLSRWQAVLTPRQEELSRSKMIYRGFEENRSIPIWPVSAPSKHTVASPRVKELARPKLVNSAWKIDRPVYTTVSKGARTAVTRERTIHLAKPKKRDFLAKMDASSTPPRSIAQLTRTEHLARPKTEHPSCLPDKPIRWPVSTGARNAVMSARLSELAQPKVRKQIFEGYNPYRISGAALHAEASVRVQELSIPQRIRKKRL
ncbi:sperm microtubule associated protein 2 isoform X1 [Pelodiscus sinensis]|uniref:sperm microtubule associated protein 2 isoform X1 n=1 Tax=Pelodiscus sinensis TaxID=13735 RepID=UPI000D723565|nr:testicular haploid expressed gene protein isoform X1 [Pelodiscus sinensis]XP_025042415.1 testicular haploid expressed gene protein isoform X2 [Pelodiscus sinensis]XP_025042416.1 testicular haploid expressed gene protein isoform X2 [Pelodiscus sinensis]XP_025042417.1 testicular haploid expressed gene protein isoform X2 [Pelodiscus sinensis]XP_025042418.1 testicular haploid expressed gene protein isoform X3 [Pelodiscus sinensis]|eukprot:XP_025042414.1 testicular haploid expressed gene protein isoform X1 [Pelodiscus sinensis]